MSASIVNLSVPNDNSPVDTTCCRYCQLLLISKKRRPELTAELGDRVTRSFICSDRVDGVLVNSLQLGIILHLSFQIHLPEHVQSRLLTSIAQTRPSLRFQSSTQLPSLRAAFEAEGLTVVASSNNPASPFQMRLMKGRSCVLMLTMAFGG